MIYLDHAATTPVDQKVLEGMCAIEQEVFGNPSSIHAYGRKAKAYLNKAREYLARSIHASEREIIFTSGGTEANNLAIIGTVLENRSKGNHIITSVQEHHSVIHTMNYLQKLGFHVTYLPVNEKGIVDVNALKRALTNDTILVSIMSVNNETGMMQPLAEIGTILKDHQAFFHTDAVQAYSLLNINVKEIGIDLLTATAHKINGPKGIGFLYINESVHIQPIQYGGLQERKFRPGTENVIGAYGFYLAAKRLMAHKQDNYKHYETLRKLFINTLQAEEITFSINGDLERAIPSIVNISFPGCKVDTLLTNFDLDGIAASSGSACTAGTIEPSHVLIAMFGKRDERIHNSIRFSFGSLNTHENVKEAASKIAKTVKRLTK